jgi:hypothetical protein
MAALTLLPLSSSVAQEPPADAPTAEVPAGLTMPEALASVAPVFPEQAIADGIEADVVMSIVIDAAGVVGEVVAEGVVYFSYDADGYLVEEPRDLTDDPYGFVPAAVDAIRQFEFAPATLLDEESGEAVAVPVTLTWRMSFVYDEVEVEVPVEEEWMAGEGSTEGSSGPIAAESIVGDENAPINLAGRCLQRGNRIPLAGVIVGLNMARDGAEPLYAETITDTSGRFAFRGLPAGTWRLVVDEADFMPVDVPVEIVEGERTDGTWFIEREVYGEYVSTVTTTPVRQEVTRRTISVSEIQRIPGNNNDAIRVVQNLPGVARPAFGGGDVIIRGSAPEDTQFLIDGMGIPAVYHFGGLRAVFPSELLQEINFLPGGYSAYYGRATGGVVEVITRQQAPETVTGHVDTNLFDTGVWLEIPVGDRAFVQLGARRSYIDAVLGAVADDIGLNFTTAPRYYDAQARVVWDINPRNRLSVLLYTSDDLIDFVNEDETGVDPQQRGGIRARSYFNGGQARLESRLSDTLTNTLTAQVYNQGLNFRLGQDLYFELTSIEHSYRDTLSWQASEAVSVRYGMDIRVTPGDIRIRLPEPPSEGEEGTDFFAEEPINIAQQFRFYTPAHFVETDIQIGRLNLLPGLRQDFFRPPGRWGVDPRFAARYQLTDVVLLKGAFGQFHQAPTPAEVSSGFGNPDLLLERAIHYIAGTELALAEGVSLNFELFYKDLSQLVSPTDSVTGEGDDVEPLRYDNGGEGRIYGGEMLLRAALGNRFYGWAAYTVSRSERLDSGENEWRLFDFDQSHILTLLGTYNLPRNWSVGTRFRLVSGNPDTPIIGGVYNADIDAYVRVAGESNSSRQPAFHALDFRVDKRWVKNRYTMNLYLDVQNVYNRMNQEDVQYSYDFEESAPVTGLPLLPALGFRFEF